MCHVVYHVTCHVVYHVLDADRNCVHICDSDSNCSNHTVCSVGMLLTPLPNQ